MEREELIRYIRKHQPSMNSIELESLSTSTLALVKTYLEIEQWEQDTDPVDGNKGREEE